MPFQPGDPNINRSGRPRGFAGVARLIAAATNDGAELVQWALAVWRDPSREFSERQAAHQWLSDRYLGRPLQSLDMVASLDVAVAVPANWDQLSTADRLRLLDAPALALPSGDTDEP
jgi:hypothetical protein